MDKGEAMNGGEQGEQGARGEDGSMGVKISGYEWHQKMDKIQGDITALLMGQAVLNSVILGNGHEGLCEIVKGNRKDIDRHEGLFKYGAGALAIISIVIGFGLDWLLRR